MLRGVYDFVASGRANVFAAEALVTAPVIWSTAAGTGGPLLYNGSNSGGGKGVTAYLLSLSVNVTTSSTVAGALGITGGPTTAPTATTAIDAVMNLRFASGAASPQCTPYRIGTVSAHGVGFLPIFDVDTGAQTVDTLVKGFEHLGGIIEVGVGNFASVAASATLTSAVCSIGLVWAEVPND